MPRCVAGFAEGYESKGGRPHCVGSKSCRLLSCCVALPSSAWSRLGSGTITTCNNTCGNACSLHHDSSKKGRGTPRGVEREAVPS